MNKEVKGKYLIEDHILKSSDSEFLKHFNVILVNEFKDDDKI